MNKISVVFFGSGPVASKSLLRLISDFTVEAIITKPATKAEMQATVPGAPVHTATNKVELEALITEHHFKSKVAILVDYGIIVSKSVIGSFPMGIINSHFSLLPQWRGADPITFTILSGQRETGVSLMLLTEGLDEGPLLAQSVVMVSETATTPQLTDQLIDISDALLKTIVPAYLDNTCRPVNQLAATIAPLATPTYSRKLTKDDGIIDWTKPAVQIEREIRAYISWPKSRTILAGKEVIVTAAQTDITPAEAGKAVVHDKRLLVGTGEGSLEILRLKPAGKAEMNTAAFLAGHKHLLE